jgi:hypothetical protein
MTWFGVVALSIARLSIIRTVISGGRQVKLFSNPKNDFSPAPDFSGTPGTSGPGI